MDRTDTDLMNDFRAGSRAAFDALVDRHADGVYSFVRRLVGDDSLAEDVAQETFIKVWRYRGRFDADRSFRPWLFAIARNAALDALRKRKDYVFSQMSDDEDERFESSLADESVSIPDDVDRRILGGALEETMAELTPDQRAAVTLHDVEGMTFEEIGKAMRKPMNTVKSHYRRAIASLRKKLEAKGHL